MIGARLHYSSTSSQISRLRNNMDKVHCLIFIIYLSLPSVFSDNCHLTVAKTLKDGDDLDITEWTKIGIACSSDRAIATLRRRFANADMRLYFANENKNILSVHINGHKVVGQKYETPHGSRIEVMSPWKVTYTGEDEVTAMIPKSWFPKNVTRMSASVTVNGVIHNFYGIFNYEISLPDTMVVEEYKKINCCLTVMTSEMN